MGVDKLKPCFRCGCEGHTGDRRAEQGDDNINQVKYMKFVWCFCGITGKAFPSQGEATAWWNDEQYRTAAPAEDGLRKQQERFMELCMNCEEVTELREALEYAKRFIGLAHCAGYKCRLPHCDSCNSKPEEIDWERLSPKDKGDE